MKTFLGLVAWPTLLLAGCAVQPAYQPYSGPVAKPQVAYRIDEHRFFEVVPHEKFACARARLYYTDTAKGIHTNVAPWDQVQDSTFVIDAATDQYLVSPIIGSSSGCQSGGSDLCASYLYYSEDFGQTWQVNRPQYTIAGDDVYLISGTVFYAGRQAALSSLKKHGYDAWPRTFIDGKGSLPPVKKKPMDTHLHCDYALDVKDK